MRLALLILMPLVTVGLLLAGAAFIIIGVMEQNEAEHTYVVGFVPGASCDDDNGLYLGTEDGVVWECAPSYYSGITGADVDLPGFTELQNQHIAGLASQLGQDGLTTAEQTEIQHNVNRIATGLPPEALPYGTDLLWGANRAWIGGLMVACALACFVLFLRI